MDQNNEEQIDLRNYLHVIMKRRWTIITVFMVIVVTVAIHSFTTDPIYESGARLIIDKENPNVVSIQEVMAVDASGTDYYQTQYKMIESRSVARKVIHRLNLDESEEFFPKPKDNLISNVTRPITDTIDLWMEALSSLFADEEKESLDETAEYDEDSDLVTRFIKKINVAPIRNSRLVDIKYRAKDPVLAAKIVNTLTRAYIDRNLETKLMAVQDAVEWLNKRIEDEQKKVEKAELALLRYKKSHNIVTGFSNEMEEITAQKLAELNTEVVEAESLRVEAETRYKQSVALMGTPEMLDSITEVLENELIRDIKTMEVGLYKRMSELSKKYGKNHPRMVAINSELETLHKRKAKEINRVVNSLKNEYMVALAREKSLKAALARQKTESLELNLKAIDYGVLKREAASARQMYNLLIKRFKEATVTEDMKTGNIRIVDRAEVPKKPVKPNKKLNIILAMIMGLALGIGLTYLFEAMDNTINVPDDIKKHLNIPYLGPVPAFATGRDGNSTIKVHPEMVTIHSPKSTASEAYRGLRTGLLFSSAENQPQAILVSSAGPREGKTITAVNVAITMAQSGSRTIILDCDLRRPKMHKIFGINREQGMTNVLVGNMDIKDVVIETEIPNLEVIPCGPIPPNPSELLGSSRMARLLEILRKKYTHIIIDSPPITAVTDASIMAKSTDGVVLVIRANDTAREIIKNGLNQLRSIGIHLLGAVLNDVSLGRDNYYYYQYYYYYYGEDDERKKKPRKREKPEAEYQDA